MEELILQIKSVLENHQILGTVAGGSIIILLINNIKYIISTIISTIVTLISFNIDNFYEDAQGTNYRLYTRQRIFNQLISSSKPLWEKTKNLDLNGSMYSKEDSLNRMQTDSKYGLTYGFSIRLLFGKIVFCYRNRNENGQKIIITTSIKVFFANKNSFMQKLNDKISEIENEIESQRKDRDTITVYNGKSYGGIKYKRSLDSIFTNNDEHTTLYNDIQKFIDNESTYKKLNYPYSYSALLYGEPGCGKSSTILAIASKLNRNIQYINLSNCTIIDLLDRLNGDYGSSIFVFEDVDAINAASNINREDSKDEPADPSTTKVITESSSMKILSVSLADLLNITDGLLSADGSICLFTTNHIEKLDPALLRAGRMNKLVEFTYMNPDTANMMIEKYLGYTIDNLKDIIKPAELQEEILNITLGRSTKEDLIRKFTKES